MRIAMIGSRKLSGCKVAAVRSFLAAAVAVGKKGYLLCTGAAAGADQYAAETVLRNGGKVQLYLPWANYEQEWVEAMQIQYSDQVKVRVLNPNSDAEAMASVERYHHNPERLTSGSRLLHARNYLILSPSTRPDVDLLIAIPKLVSRQPAGGTRQGIAIAQGLGIPTYVLGVDPPMNERLQEQMQALL